MIKKLFVTLVLVLVLAVGGVMAAEEGQICTVKQGMKIIQIMPDQALRGVITPEEISIMIGPELNPAMVANLNNQSIGDNTMDWTGGNMGIVEVDFGNGPVPVMVVVKEGDVKDCK